MPVPELWRRVLRPAILEAAHASDVQLLRRFRDSRDTAAFELLVYRHGPMVWAASRRILGNHHSAEDSFQATFLALARRGDRIRTSVPAWLHRVAVRAALDVLRRIQVSERADPDREPIELSPGPSEAAAASELVSRIDAAINRLPERLRHAVVLCDLHGYSLKEAAANLACPIGTVESRLARARRKLRGVLTGLEPSLGVILATIAVPRALQAATLRTSFDVSSVRPAIAALATRAVVKAGWGVAVPGLATAIAAALLVAAVGSGQPETPKSGTKPPAISEKADSSSKLRLDPEGVELPNGAIMRLGSTRFRHAGTSMTEVVFSPDGKRLAAGDTLGTSVFDTQTGKRLHHFPLAEGHMTRMVRFAADGAQFAVGSGDWDKTAELTVYDLASGKQVAKTKFTGKSQIFVIDVTADGKRVLIEDRFQKVYSWDIASAKELWAFDDPEGAFTMPLTADGKSFALAMSQTAELRDATTGKIVSTFPKPGPKFRSLYHASAISSDGKLATASDTQGAVAILDSRGTDPVRTFKADRHVNRLCFSHDARYLLGSGPIETLVWDTKSPADSGPIARLPGSARGGFSNDGKTLALDDVGYISLWRVGDWKPLQQSADPASPVHSVRFSADGKSVLGYTQHGWLKWPLDGGETTRIPEAMHVHHEGISHVSTDGRVGVDVLHEPITRDKGKDALRVTNFATGKTRRIEVEGSVRTPIVLSPDGRFVSLRLNDFVVWDTATGGEVFRQKRIKDRFLNGAQLAADGKGIVRSVTGVFLDRGFDPGSPLYSAVYLTDHATGRERKLDPIPWSIYSGGVQFSDDGSKLILEGHFDEDWRKDSVVVWDTRSGRRLVNWKRPSGHLESVRLSPDGRSMTIGDGSGKLAIVEIACGQERASFQHQGTILSAAFHSDGTKVVASSPEAPILVWDLLAGARKWEANKADAIWTDLASPDAKVAFGAVRTLRTNPVEAVSLLKARMKEQPLPSETKIAELLKQLDSPKFAEREQAQKELAGVADVIQPRLEAARKKSPAETARRLDATLESLGDATPERNRLVRACEVLEAISTTEAVSLLNKWADGPVGSKLTSESKDSVARLSRRK